jgi:macrolide transport system ATP-binding/permease protein
MPRFRSWLYRLVGFFRKKSRDQEMAEEIQEHLDGLIARHIAAGMSPNEAGNAALRDFGGVEQIKEIARGQRVWMWADELVQDIRFGLRMLFRNPGFSALAILCLTLAIGTNAAVFSWIEGVLFRPYPAVAHQERMFALTGTARGTPGFNDLSYPDFLDLQKNCTLIDSFVVAKIMGTSLSIGNRAERAVGGIVTANYFDALGVRPFLGRGFRPEEGIGENAHPVMLISYDMWRDRYNSDPQIVGRTQYLGGLQYTIIGVTPENFHGTFVGYLFQFWIPISMQASFSSSSDILENRGARWIEGYAFLKPGVTRAQAQAEVSAITQRLETEYPETNRGRSIQLLPLWETPFNKASEMLPTLEIAVVVVLFVLLIACANVSNLLLVRSLLRRHEMTLRMALGAGRRRVVKQLVTEGLILSVIAAVGGILVAYWCRNLLVLAFPSPAPGIIVDLPGEIDWRVLTLSAAICIGSTIIFALVPAIHASNVDLSGALKTEGGGVVGGRGRSRLRSTFVLVQVSLSFVLLAGAGLLLKSLQRMQTASPGFSTHDVILSEIDLSSADYDRERAKIFREQMLDKIRAIPGVESAAWARVQPFSYAPYSSAPITVDGYQAAPDEQPTAEYNEVGEGYFATMGIPLMSGREFTRSDDEKAPLVAIVNETMAAKYWPGKDAIGQRLRVKDKWMQVIGVAKPCKYNTMLEEPKPFFYVPLRQNPAVVANVSMRTKQSPASIITPLAEVIHTLDPDLSPLDTITAQEGVDRMSYSQQLAVTLLTVFGGVALVLAAVGLYGVLSYAVSQSTRELGLRMALGAGSADLVRLVMSRGLTLTLAGVALGGIAAVPLTRLMGKLLYKVSPFDPLTFATAFILMILVASTACFLPAWRATRINPARALNN